MEEMKSGGYTEPRPLEAHDKEVFEEAMKDIVSVVYTPELVATQVVAGTNYRFTCKYTKSTNPPESGTAIVIIFEALPSSGGKVSVTSITCTPN